MRLRQAQATGTERDQLAAELEGRDRQHPLNRLWHQPGLVTRQMLKLRLALIWNVVHSVDLWDR